MVREKRKREVEGNPGHGSLPGRKVTEKGITSFHNLLNIFLPAQTQLGFRHRSN
jgi:hypothetical protein